MIIHNRKEIENYLLVPEALDRAAERKAQEQTRRSGKKQVYSPQAEECLHSFLQTHRHHITAQYLKCAHQFARSHSPGTDESTIIEKTLKELEPPWERPLDMIPGKDAISGFNEFLQDQFGISVTTTAVINAMRMEEIPAEIVGLVKKLDTFATSKPR